MLERGTSRPNLGKQPAEVWFENDDAENYTILESCIEGRAGEALVLLHLEDKMLSAGFDPNVGTRKYNEYGSYVARKKI